MNVSGKKGTVLFLFCLTILVIGTGIVIVKYVDWQPDAKKTLDYEQKCFGGGLDSQSFCLAQLSMDRSFCNKIVNNDMKARCNGFITGDVSFCEPLIGESKTHCIALTTRDSRPCDTLHSGSRLDCFDEALEVSLGEPERVIDGDAMREELVVDESLHCDDIPGEKGVLCDAIDKTDVNLCNTLQGDLRNFCFASVLGDSSYCKEIVNSGLKEECGFTKVVV